LRAKKAHWLREVPADMDKVRIWQDIGAAIVLDYFKGRTAVPGGAYWAPVSHRKAREKGG
jgi:hypothetical protein